MTTQQRPHPGHTIRTPLITLGLLATVAAAFTAGAITFDRGSRDSGSANTVTTSYVPSAAGNTGYVSEPELADIVDSAARPVPFDVVAEMTSAEILDAERKLHDAYIDAYLASSLSGVEPAAPVREFGDLTDAELLAINREIHDAYFDAYAAMWPEGSGLSNGSSDSAATIDAGGGVPGVELTVGEVIAEHEAYISGLVP